MTHHFSSQDTSFEQRVKDSVFLPKTEFSLRAGLAKKAPSILALWEELNLYQSTLLKTEGRPDFNLHDGPPYANGELHLGHVLNRFLKDSTLRFARLRGFHAPFVPGWDCHGLPIEWKVEEKYRDEGRSREDIPVLEFRTACREFATQWVEVQRTTAKRLGTLADWDNPYLTMSAGFEADIIREFARFVEKGYVYRADRPALWSVFEQTVLAGAEVEHSEVHTSVTATLLFPVKDILLASGRPASIAIWTTTPWTIPANQALAVGQDISYGLYVIQDCKNEHLREQGLIIAKNLAEHVSVKSQLSLKLERDLSIQELSTLQVHHPFYEAGDTALRPILVADFVTDVEGTGIVHLAPAHGEDDFYACRAADIYADNKVNAQGVYNEETPVVSSLPILNEDGSYGDANWAVLAYLRDHNLILNKEKIKHSYPYSWRSKKPLIYRNTSQWFIAVDHDRLRDRAIEALSSVRFFPANTQNRLVSMVEGRPDWCLSRQRLWGVPLPLFIHKKTGEPLADPLVFERIASVFEKETSDAWYTYSTQELLGEDYNEADYERSMDVIEVWFDSGSTQRAVRSQLSTSWPADLNLEGSDQHRGWFQTSLLESVGAWNEVPYKALLTHGMVMDEKGQKMSKSLGNYIAADEAISTYGSDLLRLWVLMSDYLGDVRLGPAVLKQQEEIYRQFRNALRFLAGVLSQPEKAFLNKDEQESLDVNALQPLEFYILARMQSLEQEAQSYLQDYRMNDVVRSLLNFVTQDLSSFYFDIRKDCLYCDATDSVPRKQSLYLFEQLTRFLLKWLSAVLPFTCEEFWQVRAELEQSQSNMKAFAGEERSVHLAVLDSSFSVLSRMDPVKRDQTLALWKQVKDIRHTALAEIEKLRKNKEIGSSLEVELRLVLPQEHEELKTLPWEELLIVSKAEVILGEDLQIQVVRSSWSKCQRCWKYLQEVNQSIEKQGEALCQRCKGVLNEML